MKKLLQVALLLLIPGIVLAGPTISGNFIDRPCQAVSIQDTTEMSPFNTFSVQAVYMTTTTVGSTIKDGQKSSDNLTVTTGFGPGLAGHTIKINGVTLTFGAVQSGVTIATQATAALQAQFISSAIVNSGQFTGVITSSYAASIVYATAAVVGVNQYFVESSTTGLTWASGDFTGGFAPDVSLTDDSITKVAPHGFTTGLRVLYASSTVTSGIGGLTAGTTYFAIKSSEYIYKLATSSTNAVAGTAIDITSLPGGQTYNITPLAFVGGGLASFRWELSNDAVNWMAVPSISSVSASGLTVNTSSTTAWNFGSYGYKWLRMSFLGPTSGCVNLTFPFFGRRE